MTFLIKPPIVEPIQDELTITKWFKKSGEHVDLEETICEITGSKVIVEIYSESSGDLEIIQQEGSIVNYNQILGKIKPKPIELSTEKFDVIKTSELLSNMYSITNVNSIFELIKGLKEQKDLYVVLTKKSKPYKCHIYTWDTYIKDGRKELVEKSPETFSFYKLEIDEDLGYLNSLIVNYINKVY